MLGEDRGHEAGAVAIGGGVQIAAHILDRLADLAGRASAGALEHHMLEQMGDAVEALRLVARPGLGVEAYSGRLDRRHLAAGDLEAVGKDGELHEERQVVAQAFGGNFSRCRRRRART